MKHFYRNLCLFLTTFLIFSCSNQLGPTTDEDYAGVWDLSPGRYDGTDVLIITDTTYESYTQYPSIGLYKSHKGFIKADPLNGSMYIVTTHVFNYDYDNIEYSDLLGEDVFMPVAPEGSYLPVESIQDYQDNPVYYEYLSGLVTRENKQYSVAGGILDIDGMVFYSSSFTDY
ncbi:hypothetical protein [Oceanispirochaeta sp.]|uniref:hypothetical protein n=1 Tax=Oceanispirochaeta sp. TaxID=2035350 RepID=UPI00262EEE97|nr:hypothetical protein [Oceanispirochaeta sp.]MDA3955514.1 hypothetical protein [Oceanispirochaeta sp.]